MSALRLGRLPDGTRDIRILEPAVGRSSFTRYGIRNAGDYTVVNVTKRNFVDDRVRKNPDNGAVEASITEVHP